MICPNLIVKREAFNNMDKRNIKTLSLTCPSCAGEMELQADGKKAVCPYCGHTMLIEKEDDAQKEYERRMAKARADEDIRKLQEKGARKRRLRRLLIAVCIIAVILLLNAFIPDSPIHQLAFPETVDPFTGVSVQFSGMSGKGRAQLQISDLDEAYAETTRFEITPQIGLKNGDTVTVKAKAPAGFRFEPSKKQFTVEGLPVWVLKTDQLSGDNLNAIHANTERLIKEDWKDILSSSLAKDLDYQPYQIYLFVSDTENANERNVLYDTYEVKVTRKDGSVLTTYEACRYADLKIPADGVLTADYGNLQGFNLGYYYGFASTHSFAGWTDASEMEADLRHVRDGYHPAQ